MRLPEIEIDGHRASLQDPFAAFRGLTQAPLTYKAFVRAVTPGIVAFEVDLALRNLVPVRSRVVRAHVMTAVAVGSVAVFGLIKVVVGHARDKPAGYLLGLIVLTVVLSALIAILLPLRTALGGAVLDWYRERYRRATSARRQHEVLFAFALTGTAVLTGTHLDDVGRLIRANASGAGSDSGSSGGDGGGGCGGCGGGGD